MQIKVVIGANFGDEGKGMLTHYFSSQSHNTLNVLFNGGCQRGHTVRDHVFHCFGSGFYNNDTTYYDKNFFVDPVAWSIECTQLRSIPKLIVDNRCVLVTPYDYKINQAIELKRGTKKHGSCGMGIWEAKVRSKNYPIPVTYLRDNFALFKALHNIKTEYIPKRCKYLGFSKEEIKKIQNTSIDDFIVAGTMMAKDFGLSNELSVHPFEDPEYETIIFEGAQGLLLDENNKEFYPHVTASSTGCTYIKDYINSLKEDIDVEICYVTRSYITRHGAGYLPYQVFKSDINPTMIDRTNIPNPWQNELRYGLLDTETLLERIEKDSSMFTRPIKRTLAITHLSETEGKLYTSKGKRSVSILVNNTEIKFDKVYKFFDEFM